MFEKFHDIVLRKVGGWKTRARKEWHREMNSRETVTLVADGIKLNGAVGKVGDDPNDTKFTQGEQFLLGHLPSMDELTNWKSENL